MQPMQKLQLEGSFCMIMVVTTLEISKLLIQDLCTIDLLSNTESPRDNAINFNGQVGFLPNSIRGRVDEHSEMLSRFTSTTSHIL